MKMYVLSCRALLISVLAHPSLVPRRNQHLVRWCRRNPSYPNLPVYLLSQTVKTSHFGNILLTYLVERLEKLGGESFRLYDVLPIRLCLCAVVRVGREGGNTTSMMSVSDGLLLARNGLTRNVMVEVRLRA